MADIRANLVRDGITLAAQRALVSGNFGRSQRLLFRMGLVDHRYPTLIPPVRLTELGEAIKADLIALESPTDTNASRTCDFNQVAQPSEQTP